MLWMVQRVFFGPLSNEKNKKLKDLSLREGLVLIPFVIFVFWIGLYPKPYLNKMEVSVNHYVEQYQPEELKKKLIETPQHSETIEQKTEDVHTEY